MFQRTILRQAKAARSILSTSSSTAPLALRRTTQQQRLPAFRPLAPQSTRLYSTETKEAAKEGAEAENGEVEDPVKKELEQKTKEAIEFKVCHFPILSATGSSVVP